MANYVINELSDCLVTIAYYDVNGVPYTPTSVQWRLWDDTNKVQIQDWTTILSPATTNTFTIPGALNAMGNPVNLVESRKVIFKILAPGGAQRYDQQLFNLVNLPDVP